MLYRLHANVGNQSQLEPLPFVGLDQLGKLEKDLEQLLDDHLLDVLFEEAPLFPVFRERSLQPEADIYALTEDGDLVIFELKRAGVSTDAVQQLLRYAQVAGQWSYAALERNFHQYLGVASGALPSLREAHRDAFFLDEALPRAAFNKNQQLWLVGNAADEATIRSVEYWQKQGLSIRFAPYRIYRLGQETYFEFFSPPFDRHTNPGMQKGVLFDTNRTYDENAVWRMLEKQRISAFGNAKRFVDHLSKGDVVFYTHGGVGVIAAARVMGPRQSDGASEWYRPVKFVTAIPEPADLPGAAMSFREVSQCVGRSFFWSRTIKVPYLSRAETRVLVEELRDRVGHPS